MSEGPYDYGMRLALDQAHNALLVGEVPVGAIILRHTDSGPQVVATGYNRLITTHDPTAHAEIVALRHAATLLKNYRLPDCELYVTPSPNRTERAMGRPNHGKTTVQMPVPSRPGRHLSATHTSVGLPTGSQRPFEIPMRDKQFTVLNGISHATFQQKNYKMVDQILHAYFTQPEPAYTDYASHAQ